MGATTKSGRTRNRRAQALNSIIAGHQPTLFFYQATIFGVTQLEIQLINETAEPYANPILQPGAQIRCQLLSPFGIEPQTLPITIVDDTLMHVTPERAPLPGYVFQIFAWQESIRGQNGEWFNGAVLDVIAAP